MSGFQARCLGLTTDGVGNITIKLSNVRFPGAMPWGRIRSSPPSRRVQSAAGNVSGHYPSQKMQCTIQFESHRNELAMIYQLEHDSAVLEYFDQPGPPMKLTYQSKKETLAGPMLDRPSWQRVVWLSV